jgi:23S rRNA (adenine2503-C2)-methyltransferase
LIKITPLNPTYGAMRNGLTVHKDSKYETYYNGIRDSLCAAGYEVIISIGEPEENHIGSNCGQYLLSHLKAANQIDDAYSYQVKGAADSVLQI